MATKEDVFRLNEKYPAWTAPEIAERLNCTAAYVRATAYRNQIPVRGLKTSH